MKKYHKHVAILAAAVLTACASHDDSPQAPDNQDGISDTPIALSISTGSEFLNGGNSGNAGSRATFNTGNLSEITVMACNGSNRYFTARVTRTGAAWNTHDGFSNNLKTYYWPWSGMDVYALAGNMSDTGNALINNNCGVNFAVTGGYIHPATFNYTVHNGNDGTTGPVNDPLYAATVGCSIHDGTVNLNFRHLLSRITFAVVNDNEDNSVDIHINRIAFDNIYTSGTYTTAGRRTSVAGVGVSHGSYGNWGNLGTRANCSTYEQLDRHFTAHSTAATAQAVLKPGSSSEPYELLLMPQTLDGNVRLAVEYSITDKGGRVIRPMGYQSMQISSSEWKQNTQYIYLLHIAEQVVNVEILPVAFDVNPFIDGGQITPPVQ